MAGMINAFKKIYQGQDWLVKNIILLIYAGFTAIYYIEFAGFEKNQGAVNPFIVMGMLIFNIYMGGYMLKFINNNFKNTDTLLPDFNADPLKVFLGALPLIIVWFIYYIIFSIVGLIPILGWIFILVVGSFVPFVFIEYAKNFNSDGLFSMGKVFSYIKPLFGSFVVLSSKFLILILIVLAILFPIFYATKTPLYAMIFIFTYGGTIMYFAWLKCLVELYQKKYEG